MKHTLTRIPRDSRAFAMVIAAVCLAFVCSVGGTALWRGSQRLSRAQEMAMSQPKQPGAPGVQGAPNLTAVTVGLFKGAADKINADTAKAYLALAQSPERSSPAFRIARGQVLRAQIDGHLKRLGAEAAPVMRSAVEASARRGVANAHQQLKAIGVESAARGAGLDTRGAGFALVNAGAVETIARDSMASMLRAAGDHGLNAQAVFRSLSASTRLGGVENNAALNQAIATGIISGDPRSTQKALRLMLAEPGEAALAEGDRKAYRRLGQRQIEVGGWTGSVADYAEIVALTRTREATVEARHETLLANDINLVQITGRNTANFCTRFVNLVCALDEAGTDGGTYPLLDSLPGGGPPFHPRCSKGTVAFLPDLASDARTSAGAKAATNYKRDLAAGTLEEPLGVARRRTG